MEEFKQIFLEEAIRLSDESMSEGCGPFGCVIVKNDQIISQGKNRVTLKNDPTAHAEMVAIRAACKSLNSFQLSDCIIYCSCEPCPMCLGAIYWARPKNVFFANTQSQAAEIGFDDRFIYREINAEFANRSIPMNHVPNKIAEQIFEDWKNSLNKIMY